MLAPQTEQQPANDCLPANNSLSQQNSGLPPEAKRIIRIANEIAEKRQRLLRNMKAALMAGQDDVVINVAKELCGITESRSTSREVLKNEL